jgi:hypothetical protein
MNRLSQLALALFALAPLVAVASNQAATQPVWPSGVLDKSDTRVLAFYAGVCDQWADRNGLQGDDRENYLVRCRANGPAVFPVGYDDSEGGGE